MCASHEKASAAFLMLRIISDQMYSKLQVSHVLRVKNQMSSVSQMPIIPVTENASHPSPLQKGVPQIGSRGILMLTNPDPFWTLTSLVQDHQMKHPELRA